MASKDCNSQHHPDLEAGRSPHAMNTERPAATAAAAKVQAEREEGKERQAKRLAASAAPLRCQQQQPGAPRGHGDEAGEAASSSSVAAGAAGDEGGLSLAATAARAEFESEIAAARAQVEEAEAALPALQQSLANARLQARAQDAKASRKAVEREVARVVGVCGQVKARVENLHRMNLDNLEKPECGVGSCDARHRASEVLLLVRQLQSLLGMVQDLRVKADRDVRACLQERLQMVMGCKPTQEQVDAIMATGNANGVLRLALKAAGKQGEVAQLQAVLEEVSERMGVAEKVTEEVVVLYGSVVGMAAFISSHNDLVRGTVQSTTGKGVEDVGVALDIHIDAGRELKRTKKWTYVVFFVLGGVLLVMLGIVILMVVS